MKTHSCIAMVVTIFLTTTAANADSLIYSDIVAAAPWNPAIPVGFNIPQFDPANGTLNSVNLTLSGYADSIFTYSFSGSGGLTVWQDDVLSILYNESDVLAQQEKIFTSPNYPTPVSLPANGTMSWSLELPQDQVTFSSVPDLANFTGTGNVPLSGECYNDHIMTVTGSPAPGGWGLDNSSHLIAIVIYDFTPVPEPGVVGLLVIGGLLTMFRKHRLASVRRV